MNLTIGLTKAWYTAALNFKDGTYLSNLTPLWLNLRTIEPFYIRDNSGAGTSTVKTPTRFLDALNRPRLEILNIKFHHDTKDKQFLDVVKSVKRSCQLMALRKLSMARFQLRGYYMSPITVPKAAPKTSMHAL